MTIGKRPAQGSWSTNGPTHDITITLTVQNAHNGSILVEYGERKGADHSRILLTDLNDVEQDDWIFFLRKAVMIDVTTRDREWKKRNSKGDREYLRDRLRENQTTGPENAPHFNMHENCTKYHVQTDEDRAKANREQRELAEILRESGMSTDALRHIIMTMTKDEGEGQ